MSISNKIMNMDNDKAAKMLNKRQREILAEHHGSMSAANIHVNRINDLIIIAWRNALDIDLDTVEVHDWQRVSKDGKGFSPDRRSIAFHREMNRLKRERGLL